MKEFVRVQIPGIGTRVAQVDRKQGRGLVDLESDEELKIVGRGNKAWLLDLAAREIGYQGGRTVTVDYRVVEHAPDREDGSPGAGVCLRHLLDPAAR